jgi:hypothetical protein
MKQVHDLCIQGFECVFNASNLAALGEVVGTSLTHLELVGCRLSSDFWPAVWVHLPLLQTLYISDSPQGSVMPKDLVTSCTRATCPIKFELGDSFFPDLKLKVRLQKECAAQGRHLATVITSRQHDH